MSDKSKEISKVGRPLVYGESAATVSQRTSAFRANAKKEGLARIEAMISDELKAKIVSIAKAENLTMGEATFGLLEYGVSQYYLQTATSVPAGVSNSKSDLDLANSLNIQGSSLAFNSMLGLTNLGNEPCFGGSISPPKENIREISSINQVIKGAELTSEPPILSFLKSRNGAK